VQNKNHDKGKAPGLLAKEDQNVDLCIVFSASRRLTFALLLCLWLPACSNGAEPAEEQAVKDLQGRNKFS